ncbi:CBS domain-containing protein [Marinobacterium sediminicola]|uniref:CBS domain-containing protein n=1 Tax=Marinobacterium sediminicola TaxID=518898 RepID=A0ABY1RY55_9GAMM|nr:CBS domain-containing protein [Marinobacterium sediminicola]ULG68609.1 CBS domain-containing protein [Marinobacterium sediminicola]SMR73129.1 CBS domain-containing protein [Marinobacterium sediminicola]
MLRSVKVQDYMATSLISFSPETRLFDAIRTLQEYGISGAPVVDAEGQLLGMLSELDCLKAILTLTYHEEEMGSGGHVSDFMSTPVDTVAYGADLTEVSQRFMELGRRRLPVVHHGKLVGQISRRDVLRAVEEFAKDG